MCLYHHSAEINELHAQENKNTVFMFDFLPVGLYSEPSTLCTTLKDKGKTWEALGVLFLIVSKQAYFPLYSRPIKQMRW